MLKPEAALRKDQTNANSDMQHRHFAAVAAIIKSFPEGAERISVAHTFAAGLAHTNAKFDRARFLRACGV